VSGLIPDTAYSVTTVTADPENPASVANSYVVARTATVVKPYDDGTGELKGVSNDLLAFEVYFWTDNEVPVEPSPSLGDLLILETPGSSYPISAFAGDGVAAPEGVLDLNNLFKTDGSSLDIAGTEKKKAVLSIYRGDFIATLLMLTHYRWLPQDTVNDDVVVSGAVKGHFADINLDGSVDKQDFDAFRAQYKTFGSDGIYNPDYDYLSADTEPVGVGRVDVLDFSKFATKYGETGINDETP
jgi:hypothetical protein